MQEQQQRNVPVADDLKNKVMSYLDEERVVYFSTAEENQPRTRMMSLVPYESAHWMITHLSDRKINELSKNPRMEFIVPLQSKQGGIGWIRASGTAEVVSAPEIKTGVSQVINWFNNYFPTPDDPDFALVKVNISHVRHRLPDEEERGEFDLP